MEASEEPDIHLAYYLVLVTDVLGQRSRLRDLRSLPQSEEERAAAIEVLRDTAAFVMLWRNGFRDFFREWGSPTQFIEQVPNDIRQSIRQAFSREIIFRHLSDSVVVSICLVDDGLEGCSVLLGVLGALLAACGMHVLSLAARRPTRGGIDIGLGVLLPEGDIYGPALERAVQLESEVAGAPRIAAGSELVRFLSQVSSKEALTANALLARAVANSCQKLLFQDADGLLMLDFLGAELRQHGFAGTIEEALPRAYRFVRTAQLRYREDDNGKLAERYGLLWDYFRSRAVYWGAEIESLVKELDTQ